MERIAHWIGATRPKTWIASISPIILGSIASRVPEGNFSHLPLLLSFSLSVQIATNLFNDYFDFFQGADTQKRKGPKKLLVEQLATPKQMLLSAVGFLLLAIFSALPFLAQASPLLLFLITSCLACSIFYSSGKFSLAYTGMSDAACILYFGLFPSIASEYIVKGGVSFSSVVMGICCGVASLILLTANNLRDISEDSACGKKTLIVRLGEKFGKVYISSQITLLILLSFQILYPTDYLQLLAVELALLLALVTTGFSLLRRTFSQKDRAQLLPLAAKLYILFFLFAAISRLIP